MIIAKNGDKVSVHYVGTLSDGSVFDSSRERNEVFEFTLGAHQVIPGFENGVMGMSPGEKKVLEIPFKDAYGEYRDELIFNVNKNDISNDVEYELGTVLTLKNDQDETMMVVVSGINDDSIVLDANHPMAGKDLTFEVELLSIG